MNIGQISKRYFTNIFRNLFKANPLNSHSAPCTTILTLEQVNRFLKPCENYTKNVWLEIARTSRSLRLPNSSSPPIASISIIPPTATLVLVKDTIPFSVIGNGFISNSFNFNHTTHRNSRFGEGYDPFLRYRKRFFCGEFFFLTECRALTTGQSWPRKISSPKLSKVFFSPTRRY